MLNNFLSNKKVFISKKLDKSTSEYLKNTYPYVTIFDIATISTVPVNDYQEFDHLISDLSNIAYLIFTSSNAVDYFVQRAKLLANDLSYSTTKIICVGERTAESCIAAGMQPDILPETFSSEGIIKWFSDKEINNLKILIPGSKISGDKLKNGLKILGGIVYQIATYDIALPEDQSIRPRLNQIIKNGIDAFIFTSPSSFKNFLKLSDYGAGSGFLSDAFIIAIGPTTRKAIEEKNIQVHFTPKKFSIKDIFDELALFN